MGLGAYVRLLRDNRNVRCLWLAQFISEAGDWFYSLVLYSLMLQFTGRAETVATAVVLQLLPQFFLSPIAGSLNDRMSRRTVMIGSDLARAVVVLGMVLVTSAEWIPFAYGLLALETVLWAFFEPARTALLPSLTRSPEELAVANALSSTTWAVTLAVGAMLGGLAGVWLGREAVFTLNALSFLVSAFLVTRIRVNEQHLQHSTPVQAHNLVDCASVRDGWQYCLADRRRLSALSVKAGVGLVGAHWVLAPVLGERVFPLRLPGYSLEQAGLLAMSTLVAGRGLGALAGPLLATRWAGTNERLLRRCILAGFLLVTVGYALVATAPHLAWAALGLTLANMGTSTAWVTSTLLLQFRTEDRYRGRVFSMDFGLMVLMLSANTFVSGTLIDRGVPPRHVAAGVSVLALLPATLWLATQRWWKPDNA